MCTRASFPAQALNSSSGDTFTLHATTPASVGASEIFTSVGTVSSSTHELLATDNVTLVDFTVNTGAGTGPSINRGSLSVTSESCPSVPVRTADTGQIDPGEVVTVSFAIVNNSLTAGGDVTGLVGTLRTTGNVTNPTSTLNFGNVAHNSIKSASATFTAASVDCGSALVASVDMTDASNHNLGTVIFSKEPMGKLVGSGGNDNIFDCCATANADLQVVSNSDSPDPVLAGNNITYTINVTNNGPTDAASVTLTDAVPTGTTFVSMTQNTGPSFTCTPNTGNCSISSLASGASAQFTLVVKVNSNAANNSIITDTASISSSTADGTPGNNSATATTTVNTQADLSVTNADSPDPVSAGGNITYTINVANNGPSDAASVTLSDTVPANTTFVSFSAPAGWTPSTPAVGGTGTVTATKASLASAGTAPFTLVVKVSNSANGSTVITDTATISATTTDPTPGNNSATATTNVNGQADVSVTNSGTPTPNVFAGNNITYSITVSNAGPDPALNVQLTDAAPANTTFVSMTQNTGPSFTCTPNTANCSISSLASGASANFSFVVKVNSNTAKNTTITDTATITSPTDTTAGNNTAQVTTNVDTQADVSVTKTGPLTAIAPGGNITYSITVANSGPSDAASVQLTDAVPANTTFVSFSAPGGWTPSTPAVGGTGNVTATISSLASGATANFSFVVKISSSPASVTITNTAGVSTTTTDPTPGNNSSTANTGVASFTINDVSVTEGNSGTTDAVFTVTLSAPLATQASVNFATADGTATQPLDYQANNGTLTFSPGITTQSVTVKVIGNTIPEGNQTFFVNLSNPSGALNAKAQGLGTIVDDDAASMFQFQFANVGVNENANPGSVALTVTRSGDTSGAASVSFVTSDGTATQRSDYTFGSGVVQFGPGESQKSINILLVNDNLVEGNEFFFVTLSNPSGNSVIGTPNSVNVTINDDDTSASNTNPIDNAQFFVRQQYLDFLGREPDSAGLTFWTNQMTNCSNPPPADLTVCRVNVSAAFFLSTEFQETGGFVDRIQRAAFGRQSADPASRLSYLKFMRDTRQVGAGVVVGQSGFDTVLENNKQAYATQVVADPSFAARFPQTTAAPYVAALFASAGITPTTSESNAAVSAFGSGGTAGRVAALRSVGDSNSLRQAEANSFFVLAEYFGYLRREPTALPDIDNSGYSFWLTKLNQFNGDFLKAEMVKAFLNSSEYRQRFGP